MIKHTITGIAARERVIKRLNQFGMCNLKNPSITIYCPAKVPVIVEF